MRVILPLSAVLMAWALPFAEGANNVLSLSHYDENLVSFEAMRRAGIDGVIHEAVYPPSTVDEKYVARQNAAVKAGVLWGAYCFGNNTDGKRQADVFLSAVSAAWARASGPSKGAGVLLVLDAERNTHYPGGSMTIREVARFVDRVQERTGRYPGIYSNENWIKTLFHGPTVDAEADRMLTKCWLWIANYHYPPAYTLPWSRWSMWQYTGDGTCELPRTSYPTGVAGMSKMERTMFNGSRGGIAGWWDAHAWHPGGE